MPEKPTTKPSPFRSISKQLTKIASSTSNSDETNPNLGSKVIDDVPLNKAVQVVENNKSKPSKPSGRKVAPAPTTVIGNKDLKLKVSHNDAGRIVISLSNPDRVLVQVHVDESVLKSKGGILKKKSKMASPTKKEEKDRPKKKAPTVAKSSKKASTSTTTSRKKHSHSKRNEPRELPDEQASFRAERSKSRRGEGSTRKKAVVAVTEASQISSTVSLASSHCSDDDSTRSPLDLNRCAPKTPHTQKALLVHGDTPSTEPDIDEFTNTPTWDVRRQKMLKRQNSMLMDDPLAALDRANPAPELHDGMRNNTTQAKMESRQMICLPFRLLFSRDVSSTARNAWIGKVKSENESQGSTSHNRGLHIRQPPHPDKDDDSVNSNNRRIRKTLEEVKKVELKNKGDQRSGRSSFRNKQNEDNMDENDLPVVGSKTGSNLFSKLCDKICDKSGNKRLRKDHQKLG